MGKLKLQVWVNKKYRYGKIKSTGAVYKKNQGPVCIYIYIYLCKNVFIFQYKTESTQPQIPCTQRNAL